MDDRVTEKIPRNFFAEWSERERQELSERDNFLTLLKDVSSAVFLQSSRQPGREHW